MTKVQRRAKAQRAGARRRKVNAAVVAWKKMNPGKKVPAAVRVKRLTGGGFSVTPVKMNAAARFHVVKIGPQEYAVVERGLGRIDSAQTRHAAVEKARKYNAESKERGGRRLRGF